MVAFIQKAHGCILSVDAIEAQAAQLAISDKHLLQANCCQAGHLALTLGSILNQVQ